MRTHGIVVLLLSMAAMTSATTFADARTSRARIRLRSVKLEPVGIIRRAANRSGSIAPTDRLTLIPPKPRAQLALSPSYYEEHADRVRRNLMFFSPDMTGVNPIVDGPAPRTDSSNRLILFGVLPRTDDALTLARDLDRLMLFRDGPTRSADGIAAGVSLFTASSLGAAHAPRSMRILFDKPVHLGPAIFPNGGMGAGIGGEIH